MTGQTKGMLYIALFGLMFFYQPCKRGTILLRRLILHLVVRHAKVAQLNSHTTTKINQILGTQELMYKKKYLDCQTIV